MEVSGQLRALITSRGKSLHSAGRWIGSRGTLADVEKILLPLLGVERRPSSPYQASKK
jgi:hypothetical protein